MRPGAANFPLTPLGTSTRRALYAACAVALVLGGVYYFRHDPAHPGGLFPGCAFYRVTHLHCPGCGSQRAAHQLLHGHFLAALRCNVLLCLALPLLAWDAMAKGTWRLRPLLNRPRVGWTITWVIILFWIARNIPAWPCTLLAPGR